MSTLAFTQPVAAFTTPTPPIIADSHSRFRGRFITPCFARIIQALKVVNPTEAELLAWEVRLAGYWFEDGDLKDWHNQEENWAFLCLTHIDRFTQPEYLERRFGYAITPHELRGGLDQDTEGVILDLVRWNGSLTHPDMVCLLANSVRPVCQNGHGPYIGTHRLGPAIETVLNKSPISLETITVLRCWQQLLTDYHHYLSASPTFIY